MPTGQQALSTLHCRTPQAHATSVPEGEHTLPGLEWLTGLLVATRNIKDKCRVLSIDANVV